MIHLVERKLVENIHNYRSNSVRVELDENFV